MSLFSSNYKFKRASKRKVISKNPLKQTAEELGRDFGPRCDVVDVKIADRKINYDLENGEWKTDEAEAIGGPVTANDVRRVQNQITVLGEENNMLKLKVEILLNLVAEILADLPAGRS